MLHHITIAVSYLIAILFYQKDEYGRYNRTNNPNNKQHYGAKIPNSSSGNVLQGIFIGGLIRCCNAMGLITPNPTCNNMIRRVKFQIQNQAK